MSKFARSFSGLALIISLVIPGLSHTQERFTVDDALRMKRVGDIAISPDAASVFYSISSLDWSENKRTKRYYLAASDGSSTREFVGQAGGEEFSFSPDGKFLSFLRDKASGDDADDSSPQLFIMPTDGGEAVSLSEHHGKIVDYKWSVDAESIVFIAEELYDEEAEKEIELGADAVFVDEAPNGKERARFSNLWKLDIEPGNEPVRLTNESLVIEEIDVGTDDVGIVFVARPDTRTNYPFEAELYRYLGGEVERLTDNQAPETMPLISPGGTKLAYRAPTDSTFELRSGYFWIMDLETLEKTRLDGQNTGEVMGAVAWSKDGSALLYNEQRSVNTHLYKMDVESGEVQTLTNQVGALHARAFSADSQTMAYVLQNYTSPPDLYVSDLTMAASVRITDANPWVREDRTLAQGEALQWRGKGGMLIEGVFYPPVSQRRSSGKVPLVVEIHGGPAAATEARFRDDLQIFANAGYAVLAPNARGSSGYGDELLRGLQGEVGDGEFIDMMNGVDYVIANRNIDPDRLGVRGWSWGGVATSYTVTQTDRFKAASIGAMVGNWAAETGPGFNFDVGLWYIGGTPWDNPEEWALRSSITHVKNVTTPSIIFHGGEDTTSSTNQSLMFFTALRDIGKAPVRYIKFPRQGHGIDEPRLSRIYQMQEIKWFKQYIDGEDWPIPDPSFDVEQE